jgi:hypothetical protein
MVELDPFRPYIGLPPSGVDPSNEANSPPVGLTASRERRAAGELVCPPPAIVSPASPPPAGARSRPLAPRDQLERSTRYEVKLIVSADRPNTGRSMASSDGGPAYSMS